jgi:hypothetical protein
MESIIDERMSYWISRIDENCVSTPDESKVVDMAKKIQYLAMDMITHLCFGEPLGFVDADGDVYDFITTMEKQVPFIQHFSVLLELNAIKTMVMDIPWFRKFVVPSATDKSGMGKIIAVCTFSSFYYECSHLDVLRVLTSNAADISEGGR